MLFITPLPLSCKIPTPVRVWGVGCGVWGETIHITLLKTDLVLTLNQKNLAQKFPFLTEIKRGEDIR
jgi:hypothetical protein